MCVHGPCARSCTVDPSAPAPGGGWPGASSCPALHSRPHLQSSGLDSTYAILSPDLTSCSCLSTVNGFHCHFLVEISF